MMNIKKKMSLLDGISSGKDGNRMPESTYTRGDIIFQSTKNASVVMVLRLEDMINKMKSPVQPDRAFIMDRAETEGGI